MARVMTRPGGGKFLKNSAATGGMIQKNDKSFSFPDFEHVNDLSGLVKGITFSEDAKKVSTVLPRADADLDGLIILEDFVGTGKQARTVLRAVRHTIPAKWRVLFVPLIILEQGLTALEEDAELATVAIRPVLTVSKVLCLQKRASLTEPPDFKRIRSVVRDTSSQVLRPLDAHDDQPRDPFGYGGCGALLVTAHNTPNNTLPLIHHRAPRWSPLFRRVYHSKDG